ncbi:MAG: hypothetical protein ABJB74_08915 [Gemmatimonas sp.]
MNVSNALGFPSPTPVARRSDAPNSVDGSEAPRTTQQSAEFAAFLSMIVGTDPKLRAELKKQLPEHSAGLLDHLLASANEPTPETQSPLDAARYGMMTEAARSASAATTTPASSPTAAANSRQTRLEINAINRAAATELLSSMNWGGESESELNGVHTTASQGRISQAVLARATAGKASSLEELLAVGDHEAAGVRAGIDNVLSKAGTDEGMKLAATHAANAALSAALAASASNVNTPITDVEALDPELRNRLTRVIDRMKTEFGYDVTVVETARSQERQDMLYDQGRTTSGSIVTKTLDSMHTQGEAVDVLVDGDWNNKKGFALLQQVAKEEGMKTLGMTDPGHLELPKDSWTMNADVRVTSAMSSNQVSNGIAQVATVARVATVGVGMNVGAAQPEMPAIPAAPQPTLQTNGAAGLLLQQRDTNSNSNSHSSADSASGQASRKSSLKSVDKTDNRAASNAYQATPTDMKAKFIGPVDETQRPAGGTAADAVDRVHDINAMREQQGGKPLSQMTLEVDDVNGGTQQITIDVSGKVVDTHISAGSTSAERLRSHVNELRTGLENRGLEADSVRISTQGARTEGVDNVKHSAIADRDVMRMTGAGTAGGTSAGDQSTQQGTREKSSSSRDWDDKQAAREEQRAQNRDAQGRGSGNQDRQRPQYQEKQ